MAILDHTLAVVVPAFRAAGTIGAVLRAVPGYADFIIVVDDASDDDLFREVEKVGDPRVVYIRHEKNTGVGGSVVTGFKKALALSADLVAKVDADGQMDPAFLDRFAAAAVRFHCDYVKANRFGHLSALPAMPRSRLLGNLALSLLTKFASGCWNVFDPQNGFVLITRGMLKRLDLSALDRGYFFENSMLVNLNILRARIAEIYIPARYGGEASSMKIGSILASFPGKLARAFFRRMFQKYVFRGLSPVALLAAAGAGLMGWGALWSAAAWAKSAATSVPATAGTVVLGLLPLLLGFACMLQALVMDVADQGASQSFDYDDEALVLPAACGNDPKGETGLS